MKTLLLAKFIAPIDRPLLRDGAILFDNHQILAIGPAHNLLPTPGSEHSEDPDLQVINLANALILPGLINPHTHLELSDLSPSPSPTTFPQWLQNMVSRATASPPTLESTLPRALAIGIEQSLRFGVTTLGDITRHPHLTRPLLRQSPQRIISYGEIQALAQRRFLLDQRLAAALDPTHASDRLRIALSPHAPYTVEPHAYQRCLELSRQFNLPLATHLAETPDEATFLATHTGPFRDLWESLHAWDNLVPRFPAGPIHLARSLGLLAHPTLLAHVNYCSDDELTLLSAGRASVVYCPRTHAYFNHPPHRWRDMLARGINVAIGTDSCASSPNLNIVDDLRLLHRLAPDVPPETLWKLITLNAARALTLDSTLGSLTPGKLPDLTIFPTTSEDPLRELLESPTLPTQTWISGQQF